MDNLYSILNLYLKKEKENKKTILNIKKLEDSIEFNFNMNETDDDKTSIAIPFDDYRYNITEFINKYKNNLMVIDEKYGYDEENKSCSYHVEFNSGRVISFDGFNLMEMNSIRNVLFDITITLSLNGKSSGPPIPP